MDKEAQEKIEDKLAELYCGQGAWIHKGDKGDGQKIMDLLRELGYLKLPEEKPPLLKYQISHKTIVGSNEWHNIEGYNLGTQAQRETDIDWYTRS